MTRFIELTQIELAIAHLNKAELELAAGYSKMRLQMARRKDHQKYWHGIEQKVRRAFENLK
jgi:hypothetical protein